MPCAETLLSNLWRDFPRAKVGQYGYEAPCMDGECLAAAAQFLGGSFCLERYKGGTPQSCILRLLLELQHTYVDALQEAIPKPRYTGMNLLGAVQAASGDKAARTGHLDVNGGGAKCAWMTACVHPLYATPAAKAIGDAFWNLWLEPIIGTRK